MEGGLSGRGACGKDARQTNQPADVKKIVKSVEGEPSDRDACQAAKAMKFVEGGMSDKASCVKGGLSGWDASVQDLKSQARSNMSGPKDSQKNCDLWTFGPSGNENRNGKFKPNSDLDCGKKIVMMNQNCVNARDDQIRNCGIVNCGDEMSVQLHHVDNNMSDCGAGKNCDDDLNRRPNCGDEYGTEKMKVVEIEPVSSRLEKTSDTIEHHYNNEAIKVVKEDKVVEMKSCVDNQKEKPDCGDESRRGKVVGKRRFEKKEISQELIVEESGRLRLRKVVELGIGLTNRKKTIKQGGSTPRQSVKGRNIVENVTVAKDVEERNVGKQNVEAEDDLNAKLREEIKLEDLENYKLVKKKRSQSLRRRKIHPKKLEQAGRSPSCQRRS